MKIMHLVSGGDSDPYIAGLLEELSKEHEVELACFADGPLPREALEKGIPTRLLKKRSSLRVARNLKKYLKNKGFDLLHCHGARANLVSALLGSGVCPVLSTVSANPWLDGTGAAGRLALRLRDGVVARGEGLRKALAEGGLDSGRLYAICPGIRFSEKMSNKPRQEYLRSLELDWNDGCIVYGTDARMESGEELETLVSAFAKTAEAEPNARLLIAGTGSREPQIRARAEELCPAGTVCFVETTDWNSFYHALDVNLVPQGGGGFPYAILEGARMYCCTISTAGADVSAVLRDGETGCIAESGDVDSLAQCMIRVARDPRLRVKMGGALHEWVGEAFSLEEMARQLQQIYGTVRNRWLRQQQGRYGAVICGAYGKNNAGDEAILRCMIRQLRQQDPDLPITVLSHDPSRTGADTGVSAIHSFDLFRAGRRMKKSKLYISGGGSLLQNVTSSRSLLYYLFSIRQAKRAGCKVMIYGCGIGPVNGERDQKRTARILEKYVDLIALRDPDSMETLKRFGVKGPKMLVTADPALLMEADDAAAERYWKENGLDPKGNYSLFLLRPWDGTRERLGAICAAADYGWEKYGMMPLFYPMEPGRDAEVARAAAELVKAPCRVLGELPSGEAICGLMGQMKLVVSMRLHGLIFACARQTRIAAISYDPKVSGFMNYLDSDCCVELADVTESTMRNLIDRAMTQDLSRNVATLKELAAQNGILAGELLRM